MTSRIGTLGFLLALSLTGCVSLTGCGHTATESATLKSGGAPGVAAGSPPSPARSGYAMNDEAPAASPPAAEAAAGAGAMAGSEDTPKADSEHPGLGTSWGEAVSSRVTSTSFYRHSMHSPDGLASLYYNDEAGVTAMSRGRYLDYTDSVVPLVGGRVTVSLVDPSGSPLRAAHVDGRTIAVGSDGDRYIVRVDNHSPVRIEAVATVDGLDVVDGSDGNLEKRGYVIAPYDSLDIEGFRESQGSVRAFRFGRVSDSYAARRGKDRNVGVIGVAVFREQGSDFRWDSNELQRRESADPFPSHFAPAPPSRY